MSNLWWRNFYLCVSLVLAWIAMSDSLVGETVLAGLAITNALFNLFFAWRFDVRMRKEDGSARSVPPKKKDGSAGN